MKQESLNALIAYLKSHESDIFYAVNDFGELRGVFLDLMGYEPTA